MRKLDGWVIVLDLDDTLYQEDDYVLSGIHAVTAHLNALYGAGLGSQLIEAHAAGTKDIWGLACTLLGLPSHAKESMLWLYRLHVPAIALHPEVAAWVGGLEARGAAVAVLTDGRSVTQRLKLQALGLGGYPAFISEEHGSDKPHPARFEAIMARWPGQRYLYVGDNTRKDFIAPNALGWLTIGLLDQGRNVHAQDLECAPQQAPRHWVRAFDEVERYLA